MRTKPKARDVCEHRKRRVARARQLQGCLCACPRPRRGGLRNENKRSSPLILMVASGQEREA